LFPDSSGLLKQNFKPALKPRRKNKDFGTEIFDESSEILFFNILITKVNLRIRKLSNIKLAQKIKKINGFLSAIKHTF